MITLELESCSDYFVTRANLVSNNDVQVEQKSNNSVYYIIMAVELAVILALAAFIFLKVREPSMPSVKMRKPESRSEDFFDTFDDYETTDIKK